MEKINISKLLKDCPTGYPLDCSMYEDVYFDFVDELNIIHCYIQYETHKTSITFNQHGTPHNDIKSKCVIFPKGKTTWEEFHRPFKDGDIIADEHGNIAIYKGTMWYNKKLAEYYCGYRKSDNRFLPEPKRDGHFGLIEELHYATEEEKQKLFDAIKASGFKWNAETKTLEKLIEPKFKVGDKVRHKNNHNVVFTIISIEEDSYVCGAKMAFWFDDQDNYELVPKKFDINTLKPFDSRVLVRNCNSDRWKASFWGCLINSEYGFRYDTTRGCYKQCIPYEGNEHLLGKTASCNDFYKTW